MNYEISHYEMFSHAMDFYGLKEIKGEKHNPRILSFFEEIGHSWVQTDETAWCSAFINYLAKKCGYAYSGKLDARSWLSVGVEMRAPTVGDIVVFWRESITSWKGHVGIYVRHDGENIWTLGGNQNNSVCIKPYPADRLLGYRALNKKT
jgi:uncharacterized protein (TIGR02594 family)